MVHQRNASTGYITPNLFINFFLCSLNDADLTDELTCPVPLHIISSLCSSTQPVVSAITSGAEQIRGDHDTHSRCTWSGEAAPAAQPRGFVGLFVGFFPLHVQISGFCYFTVVWRSLLLFVFLLASVFVSLLWGERSL